MFALLTSEPVATSSILEILLNPAVTLCIGILTVFITRNGNISSISRERLEKVYHPLFTEIEPFLFKRVTYEEITPFLEKYYEIEKQYSLLINPSLREYVHDLNPNDKVYEIPRYGYNKWFFVCNRISKDYDSLCRKSHLPLRDIAYRVNHRQYKNRLSLIFAILWLSLPLIVFCSFLLALAAPKLLYISYTLFFVFLLKEIVNSL